MIPHCLHSRLTDGGEVQYLDCVGRSDVLYIAECFPVYVRWFFQDETLTAVEVCEGR
jgi:hypothetical protein